MDLQSVSLSFLESYERDGDALRNLCRTCLCKTDDEYASIHSILPWTQRDVCTAQKMIQQIVNRELSKKQPQPQRICSKCIKKIRAISLFRNQCLDAENILNEFHQHIESKSLDGISDEYTFADADDMLSEEVEVKFLNMPDVFKTESISSDDLFEDENLPEVKTISPNLRRPRRQVRVPVPFPVSARAPVVRKPAPKKKRNKSDDGDVDKYVNQLIDEDITASLKSLEKKYKKETLEAGGLCEQCGLSFVSASEYKKHIRSHDDKAKQSFRFQCQFCPKGFNHKQTYNIHHNSHTREIKFICDMCGKSLATKNSLRIHFRYHLGIKNHECPKCGHRFVTPRELRDHVDKRHAASRAIACTYSDCSETFDSEYRLNLHIRVHETNYAFVCDICNVACVSKFRLGIHKKIHTGEMIRHCPICNKRLAHDNALRRHIRNVHGEKNKTMPKKQPSHSPNAPNSIAASN